MSKKLIIKAIVICALIVLASTVLFAGNVSALLSQNEKHWYWISDTDAPAMVTADVDGDGGIEVVTGGYFNDGTRWIAQLAVWNGTNLGLENVKTWYWTSNTQISAIATGNVDADGAVEIVTAGAYFDGTRWIAQLAVWNGATLALENVKSWYWTSDTQISSVAIGDVTGDAVVDIVTGGTYNDGTRDIAQLVVWNGATLALENVKVWYWNSNTYIKSVAIANVDADPALEIITGGAYFDGTRWIAQLVVWNGTTFAVKSLQTWYWTGNTDISSVVAGDVDNDGAAEIVTGGTFFDGTNNNGLLAVWTGSTLVLENVKAWLTTSDTSISSVAYADVNADGLVEIVTGGKYFDGTRYDGQITIQAGATLVGNTGSNWFTTADTNIGSIAVSNVTGAGNRIVTSGSFYDLTRSVAQITVWG